VKFCDFLPRATCGFENSTKYFCDFQQNITSRFAGSKNVGVIGNL
jgi:hypothetical protein